MRATRFGGFLLGVGAGVGIAAVLGLVFGFRPSRLPPALIDLAVYKLTFIAAAGLLTAGAALRRYGKRDADHRHVDQLAPPHPFDGRQSTVHQRSEHARASIHR